MIQEAVKAPDESLLPYLQLLGPLIGACIGGGLAILSQHLAGKRSRESSRIDLVRQKLEEMVTIAAKAGIAQRANMLLLKKTITPTEDPKDFIERALIWTSQLRAMASIYCPEAAPSVEASIDAYEGLREAVANKDSESREQDLEDALSHLLDQLRDVERKATSAARQITR